MQCLISIILSYYINFFNIFIIFISVFIFCKPTLVNIYILSMVFIKLKPFLIKQKEDSFNSIFSFLLILSYYVQTTHVNYVVSYTPKDSLYCTTFPNISVSSANFSALFVNSSAPLEIFSINFICSVVDWATS